jgi:hypothetical protein
VIPHNPNVLWIALGSGLGLGALLFLLLFFVPILALVVLSLFVGVVFGIILYEIALVYTNWPPAYYVSMSVCAVLFLILGLCIKKFFIVFMTSMYGSFAICYGEVLLVPYFLLLFLFPRRGHVCGRIPHLCGHDGDGLRAAGQLLAGVHLLCGHHRGHGGGLHSAVLRLCAQPRLGRRELGVLSDGAQVVAQLAQERHGRAADGRQAQGGRPPQEKGQGQGKILKNSNMGRAKVVIPFSQRKWDALHVASFSLMLFIAYTIDIVSGSAPTGYRLANGTRVWGVSLENAGWWPPRFFYEATLSYCAAADQAFCHNPMWMKAWRKFA